MTMTIPITLTVFAKMQVEGAKDTLEPPTKKAKALSGLPVSGDVSSEDEDILLPVEEQGGADSEEETEFVVPKQATSKVN